eukprot:TRINITY_DN32970_c0_g1_i1.p1 TRINITY_DN32970_c0_g1~~TRINITY_DN32970_c0_g1_i1.p1  ORF type:complete len:333 (+),score=108.79 TRINITY_DN32970_c0_g1_i1:67-1065(+)
MEASEWFLPISMNAHQEAPCRMFVFPFAGGNPKDFVVDGITSLKLDTWALCLPGRGKRRKEQNISDIAELVPLMFEAMRPYLDVPYVFFGYSMGALVAYELCRYVEQQGMVPPRCVFVVADEAPQTQRAFIDTQLSDADFAKELGNLGLTSRDVLESEEMLAVVLPQIRADMMIENEHRYTKEPRLSVPVVGVCGTEDRWVDEPKMRSWAENTTAAFDLKMISGAGHIFLQDDRAMAELRAFVLQWCSRTILTRFARGPEEAKEVARVEQQHPVKKLGNCWVKWDAKAAAPKRKPATFNASEAPGLGAWFADVKEQLVLRGYSDMLDPAWEP